MNVETRLNRLFARPNKEDILYFLKTRRPEDTDALYRFADEVRHRFVGDAVHLRGLIEFSNHCKRECIYCGLNKGNKELARYRMPPGEIIAAARDAYKGGFRTVVLQSGEDPYYTLDHYLTIIREIKKIGDIAVTLSIGEKDVTDYRAYYHAGADRFLLKHETSDNFLYWRLNPGMTLENRIKLLKTIKSIGFQTGGGIMVGLPAQTRDSIAEDILLFRQLDLDMLGCGPFIPHPATRLGAAESGSVEMTYRVLALNRIVTRDTHLPVTTALSTLSNNETEARTLALRRGANVIMPDVTPPQYRQYYEIYPNKARTDVDTASSRKELEALIASLGRYISDTPGHRKKRDG